ncbi:hypothetical protein CKA38_12880 [Ereboglobus luteus]|uniref:Uncharacterized protein n=1 Tax=Ereboglobus luteus TaxID=1796921 RepID=A0A2U8E597_9BACT|nr:hypothetical protein CKA38_12880 [Ereboglobus luteus]
MRLAEAGFFLVNEALKVGQLVNGIPRGILDVLGDSAANVVQKFFCGRRGLTYLDFQFVENFFV